MASTPQRRRVARGSLSPDRIVDATLQLLADDPDAAITMERVADSLGTRPMSLYTHVKNRDELMSLAAQKVWLTWTATVPEDADWERQLTAWCSSLSDHVRRFRPLLMEMTGTGTFQPALVSEVASLARILRRAGLEGAELVAALRWIPQTVLGAVVLELGRPAEVQTPEQEAAAVLGVMAELDDDDRRELAELIGHFASPDLPELSAYTNARIVDGVRAVAEVQS